MITVIIAGGSGTRLWPLSTPQYPKHLMKLNGDHKSLLQNTYERAKKLSKSIYVISDISHAEHVKAQLPDLTDEHLLIEPGRRGTANCVAAALAHLTDRHKSDETVAFIHADHYIRDISGFVHSFKMADQTSRREKKIVLVGVEPEHPATGFGYIKKGKVLDEDAFVFSVDSFKEKPDFELAKEYVNSGQYLWNCGYFVGSVDIFKDKMSGYSPEMMDAYEKLLKVKSDKDYEKTYLSLEDDAIDYALIEKNPELLVTPATFDWMDVGSYGDLHKALDSDESGNHVHGEKIVIDGVENSFVQNHGNQPVAVIGLDNIVVVNTKDGILVARKDLSKNIGQASKHISKHFT